MPTVLEVGGAEVEDFLKLVLYPLGKGFEYRQDLADNWSDTPRCFVNFWENIEV